MWNDDVVGHGRRAFENSGAQNPSASALTDASRPPSTGRLAPLIQRAPSEERKAMAGAMSGEVPARPTRAMSLSTRSLPSTARNSRRIGVSTGPGLTALTRKTPLFNNG